MASKTLISISSSKDLLQGGTKLLLTYFVFIGVRCLSVCLCMSVCLLAYYEKKNSSTDVWFSWNFQSRWDLIQGTIGNIFRKFHLTPWTHYFPPTFSGQSMPLSSITEKRLNRFSWNLLTKNGHDAGSNLEHFRDVTVNPLNHGSIYLFRDFFYETSGIIS